ncbi:mucin-like protein [Moniliophthora roreri MCA 2997]|uniref:Mucin-like protein n=1 Tax=Moniliophthora roreri (strain MCA 2997) TaxID=1381753 RepID=V2YKF8_MONRO|nr:mucin-like protein [Moniliophthora roreri MCA 2997]
MSSHFFRLFYRTAQPCLRQSQPQCQHRTISYSLPRASELSPEPATAEEVAQAKAADEAVKARLEADSEGRDEYATINVPKSFTRFMEEGYIQRLRTSGTRNWLPARLGTRRPFPLNPTFNPPPPISDAQKTEMYQLFMEDPKKNSVRALSQRYHVSLKRVDAILRLKGMEHAWVKEKKPLQTGFVRGMERILGVPTFKPKSKPAVPDGRDPRYDAYEADSLEELEQRDAARQRYQRMYWETLDEGGSAPVAPAAVEHAKKMAIRLAQKAIQEKNAKFLPTIADTDFIKWSKDPVVISTKPGRPAIHFVDVGAKYVDATAEMKRLASAGRRSRYRLKKAAEKQIA